MKLTLIIPGRLPSWNAVLGMNHWQRMHLKEKEIQPAFLCALRACAADSSMKTTFAKNTMSIAAATLDSYLVTTREKRRLKQRNARRKKAKKNLS